MTTPLRITVVSTTGLNRFFRNWPDCNLPVFCATAGHKVNVYAIHNPRLAYAQARQETIEGVPVRRLRKWGWFAPGLLPGLLWGKRPDVVHINHLRNHLAFQTALLCRLRGIPLVMTPHGVFHDEWLIPDRDRPFDAPPMYDNLIFTPGRLLYRILKGGRPTRHIRNFLIHAPLRMADIVVADAHHERHELARLGISPARTRVLWQSVDSAFGASNIKTMNTMKPDPSLTESSENLARPLITFIGQLKYRKGFDVLARGMPVVTARYPGATFVIVTHTGTNEEELRHIVEENGTAGNLKLLYNITEEEKEILLRRSDVIVMPSRYEGFGIPAIEAMAAGTPLVASDVVALNETVQHEANGLLFPSEDHTALGQAILRILDDPALRERLIAGGRRSITEHYRIERVGEELLTIFREAISQPRQASPWRRPWALGRRL